METTTKKAESNKVAEGSKRAVTISVTANDLRELGENPELLKMVAQQMDESQGNLKGKFAIAIAKALVKQGKLII